MVFKVTLHFFLDSRKMHLEIKEKYSWHTASVGLKQTLGV